MTEGTYQAADIDRAITYIGPHGNVSRKTAAILIPATASNAETFDFMRLPNGTVILDCFLNVIGAPGAAVTLAVGLAQIPNKSAVKVDADALIVATAAAVAIIIRRNKVSIDNDALSLDDDYFVQALIGGADITNAFDAELTVLYENRGTI